jgi:hypothetical protein
LICLREADLLGPSRNNLLDRIFEPEREGGKNNIMMSSVISTPSSIYISKLKSRRAKLAGNILLMRKGNIRNIFLGIIKESWGRVLRLKLKQILKITWPELFLSRLKEVSSNFENENDMSDSTYR